MLYLSSIVQPVAGEPRSANFNHQNICNKRIDRCRTRMKRLRRRSILSAQRLNPQLLFDARTVGAQASTAVTSKTLVIQACAWLPITVRGHADTADAMRMTTLQLNQTRPKGLALNSANVGWYPKPEILRHRQMTRL
jgi:hypothetical protein